MCHTRMLPSRRRAGVVITLMATMILAGCARLGGLSEELELNPYHQATFHAAAQRASMKIVNHGPAQVHVMIVHTHERPMATLLLYPRSSVKATWDMVDRVVLANVDNQAAMISYDARGFRSSDVEVTVSLTPPSTTAPAGTVPVLPPPAAASTPPPRPTPPPPHAPLIEPDPPK